MIKNYFYLIVGVLCILFAVTHTVNGVTTTLKALDSSLVGEATGVSATGVLLRTG